MFSEMLVKLWESGTLQLAIWETVYMTLLATLFAYLFGLPLGILLAVTDQGGIRPMPVFNKILGFIVNVFRSMPFIILMVGTSIGNSAMIVTLVIAATPYVARMVESSIKEVDAGVIEAAQSMGTTNFGIIYKVLIPEAKPSLIIGAVISVVTILGYSAMAGTVGGGGLGMLAISYGHQRSNPDIIWVAVVLTIIIVQVIQELGMRLAHKTDKRRRD